MPVVRSFHMPTTTHSPQGLALWRVNALIIARQMPLTGTEGSHRFSSPLPRPVLNDTIKGFFLMIRSTCTQSAVQANERYSSR